MFNFFKILDNLKDAEEVIARDKRISAQYEDKKKIRAQGKLIFLLVLCGLVYFIIQLLPKEGDIREQKNNETHETPPKRDTVPNIDGIEI